MTHLDPLGISPGHLRCSSLPHPLQQRKQVGLARQLQGLAVQGGGERSDRREVQRCVAVEDADGGLEGVQALDGVEGDLQLAAAGQAVDGGGQQEGGGATHTALWGE